MYVSGHMCGPSVPHPDCVNRVLCLGCPARLAFVGCLTPLSVARLLAWSLSGPCTGFLEEFCQVKHLMVPCVSAVASARQVLAVGAASHVFTTEIISHVLAL